MSRMNIWEKRVHKYEVDETYTPSNPIRENKDIKLKEEVVWRLNLGGKGLGLVLCTCGFERLD